jgi:hypothetical protein
MGLIRRLLARNDRFQPNNLLLKQIIINPHIRKRVDWHPNAIGPYILTAKCAITLTVKYNLHILTYPHPCTYHHAPYLYPYSSVHTSICYKFIIIYRQKYRSKTPVF